MKTTLEILEATEKREIEDRRYKGNHPTMFAQLMLNSHFSGSGPKSFGAIDVGLILQSTFLCELIFRIQELRH